MHKTPRIRMASHGVALVSTGVLLLLRWPLWPVLGSTHPSLFYIPAVMLSASLGGLWPGLLATLLSALAADYFLIEPRFSFGVADVANAVAFAVFVLIGTFISVLSESLHRARHRLLADARQRADQTLRATEERFRGTFENAAVGIAHLDAAGRYLNVNQKFCDITGYSRPELLAMSFPDVTHPDDLVFLREPFAALMRGEVPSFSQEKRYLRKDGTLMWGSVSVSLQRATA